MNFIAKMYIHAVIMEDGDSAEATLKPCKDDDDTYGLIGTQQELKLLLSLEEATKLRVGDEFQITFTRKDNK